MTSSLLRGGLLGLAALWNCGCGGTLAEPRDRPKRVSAIGVVSYKGVPVEGAIVVFTPEGEGVGALGRTDAKGQFSLTTFLPDDGAVPGSYHVSVRKVEIDAPPPQATEDAVAPPTVERSVLPDKYADPQLSGLKGTVADGTTNEFTFDLQEGPIGKRGPQQRSPRLASGE